MNKVIKRNLNDLRWRKRYTFLRKIMFTEKELCCKGTKAVMLKYIPGAVALKHYHKYYYELYYIKEGSGLAIINGRKYILKTDDFFLIKPKDIHEIINNSDKDLIVFIFKTNDIKPPDKVYVK